MAVAAASSAAQSTRDEMLAYAGLGLSTLGWATAFLIGKPVLAQMQPLPAAAGRSAVAATGLRPFATRQRPGAGLRRSAGPLAVMAICGGVFYPWLFLMALSLTSATNTALLIALN